MKILVTDTHMTVLAGAALVALEVAVVLRDLGHRVELCAGCFAAPMEDEIQRAQLPYHTLQAGPNLYEYDFVWAQGHIAPALLAAHPIAPAALPRIVAVSLSPYDSLAMPGAIVELAGLVVANSHETASRLAEFGVAAERVFVFDNAPPPEFIASRPPISALAGVLAVANHAPPELEEAFDLLRAAGVEVTRVGIPHQQTRVTPELVQRHDAVVTIGKTVQYAIQAETPVYVYDRFGGPGWLAPENADRASHYNFSGRCCGRKLDAAGLRDEIIGGHAAAATHTLALKQRFGDRFDLRARLREILDRTEPVAADRRALDCVRREGVLARETPQWAQSPANINRLVHQAAELTKEIEATGALVERQTVENNRLAKLVETLQRDAQG